MMPTSNSWVGTTTGTSYWDIAGNWSGGNVPTSGANNVYVTQLGTYSVIIQATDPTYTLRSLTLGSTSGTATLIDNSSLTVSTSATMTGASNFIVGVGGTANFTSINLSSAATITVDGALNISNAITGSGTINVDGGELFSNSIGGTDQFVLTDAGLMTTTTGSGSTGTIVFGDGTADQLDIVVASTSYNGQIQGFGRGAGNVIDLESLAYSPADTYTYSGTNLTISNNGSVVFQLTNINNPGDLSFTSDGSGGTVIAVSTGNRWVGATTGSSNWDIGSNWSGGHVPTSGSSDVFVTSAGNYSVVIQPTDPTYTLRSLTLGSATGTVNLVDNSSLTVSTSTTMNGASNLVIGADGTANFASINLSSAATITVNGALNVGNAITGSGTINVDGGELFSNSIGGDDRFVLTNAGDMTTTTGSASAGTVVFGDSTGDQLDIVVASTSYNGPIQGFGVTAGNMIDLESLAYSPTDTYAYTNSNVTISDQGSVIFQLTNINDPGNLSFTDDGSGGTLITACFLAGTNILTDRGEVVVQELLARHQLGLPDQVATLEDGQISYREITWAGMRHVSATEASAPDRCPIRIRKGAFAEAVPHRDLLVTPEHCIFVDGRLVPARMLVNHRSIIEDRSIGAYSYYHLELAHHAILLAEGLPTESYLDTGNRASFSDMTVTTILPEFMTELDHKSWSCDACAPLTVDQETVQPIWESLDQRATMLGIQVVRAPLVLSDEPQLRLLLSDGQELQPRWNHPDHNLFQIPPGTRPVRLLSCAARPSEVIGPYVNDRRDLGVAVAKLVLWDGLNDTTIEASALALPGWHALENSIRWTCGNAELELPYAGHVDTFLDIYVTSTMRYPVHPAIAAERIGASA